MTTIPPISPSSHPLPKPALVAAELVALSTPGRVLSTPDAERFFGNNVTQLPSVRPNQDTGFTYFGNVLTTRKGHTLIGDEWPVGTFLQRVDKFTPGDSALRTTEGGPLKKNALSGFFTGNSPVITVEPTNPSTVSVLYKANALIERALQSLYGKGPQHGDPSYRSAFNRYCQEQFPHLTELLSDPKILLESRNSILNDAMYWLALPFPNIAKGWLGTVINMIKSK